jgi:hypothetical protein
MQRDVADDAVALVEDREHRDALRHRRNSGLARRPGCSLLRRDLVLLGPAVARGDGERQQQRCGKLPHAYSGIHGS